jgi:hypothetical protein
VHVLEGGSPERSVGLEIVAKTILSYQSLPIPLSREEARSLATMLEQAAKEAPG